MSKKSTEYNDNFYDKFINEFKKLEPRRVCLGIISIILLLISISFNFKKYEYTKKRFNFINLFDKTSIIDIKPSLLSTVFSIGLFGGFITRNINEIIENNVIFLFIFLDLIFFSGLISVFLSSKDNFFGFSNQALLLLVIAFMWVGMRSLTGYALALLLILSFFHISNVNDAMGFDGCIYILFAFMSFLIQMYLNLLPTARFHNFKRDFLGDKYWFLEINLDIYNIY